MKKSFNKLYPLFVALAMLLGFAACDSDNTSDLRLNGETYILSLSLDSYEAEIDNVAKTIKVGVPVDFDTSRMRLSAITMSEGAAADIAVGETVDCTVPRHIRITNGDSFTDYILTVTHDNVEFLSFTVNSKYQGTIDNEARTILVFVPMDTDLTSMLVTYTLSEGATAEPASSSVLDLTNPVEIVATYRSAVIPYTVTVIRDDMSQEPKAFIGNAPSIGNLGDEARTAAMWMIDNVPNTTYVSLQSILDGTVRLSDFKMVWCHFDWLDWPGIMWDSRDIFNDYYIKGGNILASRDGARYINDVWRITLDQQSPNNMFGGDAAETLKDDLGLIITADHEIFNGLPTEDNRILLVSKGCSNTNRTLQWAVDWSPYNGMTGWEERTGAKALASDNGGDMNHVTIAEIVPREVLKGYRSGTVLTVGTPAYEWHQATGNNAYRPTMEKFTKNMINYLCK